MRQVLQNGAGITKWGNYYKVGEFIFVILGQMDPWLMIRPIHFDSAVA